MKKLHLITAILLTVKSFGDEIFSMYDVTSEIREDLINGGYQLVETGDTIIHKDVKESFIELYDARLFGDLYHSYDATKGYREFCMNPPINNIVAKAPKAALPPTISHPQLDVIGCFPQDVQSSIITYLKSRGIPTTTKQIQSRIKNYTCDQIKSFLIGVNLIDHNTANEPASKVQSIAIVK